MYTSENTFVWLGKALNMNSILPKCSKSWCYAEPFMWQIKKSGGRMIWFRELNKTYYLRDWSFYSSDICVGSFATAGIIKKKNTILVFRGLILMEQKN